MCVGHFRGISIFSKKYTYFWLGETAFILLKNTGKRSMHENIKFLFAGLKIIMYDHLYLRRREKTTTEKQEKPNFPILMLDLT
jgi:hypothetical protein